VCAPDRLAKGIGHGAEILRDALVETDTVGRDVGSHCKLLHVHAWPRIIQRATLSKCNHLQAWSL
jgi:hypothetical protein